VAPARTVVEIWNGDDLVPGALRQDELEHRLSLGEGKGIPCVVAVAAADADQNLLGDVQQSVEHLLVTQVNRPPAGNHADATIASFHVPSPFCHGGDLDTPFWTLVPR